MASAATTRWVAVERSIPAESTIRPLQAPDEHPAPVHPKREPGRAELLHVIQNINARTAAAEVGAGAPNGTSGALPSGSGQLGGG